MRKIFTLALLTAAVGGLQAENTYTERIDPATLSSLEGMGTELVDYSGPYGSKEDGSDFALTSEYSTISIGPQVGVSMDGTFFEINYGSKIYTSEVTTDLYIKSVTFCSNWGYGNLCFSLDGPVSDSGKYDYEYEYVTSYSYSPTTYTLQNPARYFTFDPTQCTISYIEITWTDVAPVPDAPTPYVYIDNEYDGVCHGATLHVNNSLEGATLRGTITDGGNTVDVEATEFPYEYTVTGNVDETFSYDLWIEKDGYNPSQHATNSYTLVAPRCDRPVIDAATPWYPGKAITINNAEGFENALISYQATYYDYESWENVTLVSGENQTAPVTFTLPEDIPVGVYVTVYAKATADGYRESEESYSSGEIASLLLSAPVLYNGWNTYDGGELMKGTTLTLRLPSNATETHYTLNGGEELVSTDYEVNIIINEDTEIVAWATGEEPFQESEHAVYNVVVENLGANVDVITAASILGEDYSYSDEDMPSSYNSIEANEHNGAAYMYHGGFYYGSLYSSNSSSTNPWYVANTTTGGYTVTGIRVDVVSTTSEGLLVYFDDEPLAVYDEATGTTTFSDPDVTSNFGSKPYYAIADEDFWGRDHKWAAQAYTAGTYGQWIKTDEAEAAALDAGFSNVTEGCWKDKKYFLIRPFYNVPQLTRILIEYSSSPDDSSAIDALDSDNNLTEADAVYYNLNGIRVNGANLAPGLYIRVAGTKASKVLVK